MYTHEVLIGPLAQIPAGEGRVFQAGARQVAIFHARDGALYATQAECPHRGGPLADGLLGDGTLICPLHGRKFDLRSGAALQGGCGLTTYPLRLTAQREIILTLDDAVAVLGKGAEDSTAASASAARL
jgi:nitrite reductase (NADH) small subunit